jgi:NADPH:quinone reductase
MNMERAARIHQYGAPEVLAVEPVEVTAPGPGEVRIRHTAIGLNFVEVYFRRGTFPVPAFPAILGNEAAGVIEAVGRDVRGVAVGDRVAYADGPLGSYATARLCPADLVVRIPDAINDPQAAASFLRGVTARSAVTPRPNRSSGVRWRGASTFWGPTTPTPCRVLQTWPRYYVIGATALTNEANWF